MRVLKCPCIETVLADALPPGCKENEGNDKVDVRVNVKRKEGKLTVRPIRREDES